MALSAMSMSTTRTEATKAKYIQRPIEHGCDGELECEDRDDNLHEVKRHRGKRRRR